MTDTQAPTQTCEFCGDPFTPNRNGLQKYCSVDCRYRAAKQVRWERRQAEKQALEAIKRGRELEEIDELPEA